MRYSSILLTTPSLFLISLPGFIHYGEPPILWRSVLTPTPNCVLAIDPDFRWKDYYQNLYTPHNPALSANRAWALEELAALCKAQNIELLFVNFPELHQLTPYPFPETTAYVAQLAQENALPFVDLLSCFENEPPESLWVSGEDTHGNGKANRIAAHALYQALRTHAADYFTEGVSRPKKNPGSASLPEVSDK